MQAPCLGMLDLAPFPHSSPSALVSVAWQTTGSFARLSCSCSECILTPISISLSFMAMAIAINTSCLALELIPHAQEQLDRVTGGRRRYQVHRLSVYATIVPHDSEFWPQLYAPGSTYSFGSHPLDFVAKQEAMEWQADPDDDLSDAAVLHHLHQQAATVPFLSSVISRRDHGNARTTTIAGSALSASINAATQGRPLSSFHCQSLRPSSCEIINPMSGLKGAVITFPLKHYLIPFDIDLKEQHHVIVWAGPHRNDYAVFLQAQLDVVDLFSRRTLPTSRPGKRRRTAFNQFLQVSHAPVVEDTSRGNSLVPHARRFNGVRHRPDRRTWVAEMKPPKHKTKQDFGNFKSEVQAARAVDAAFHHYGRPELLNFPDTSLQFLSTRTTAPPELDEKAKVKFVKEEAKLLLAAMSASSPLHSTHTNSLQIPDSPRRCSSGYFRSFSEISWPLSCSDPDEVDDNQSQPWVDLNSTCDISSTGVQRNLEVLTSVQNAEQGWGWAEDSSTLAAPPVLGNSSASEIQSQ